MGANVKSIEVASPTGGRGKTMKLYVTPIITFGYGTARGYTQASHQAYSSNTGWATLGLPV